MQRKRRRKQMASEGKILSPLALFTAMGLQIATVQNGFRAQSHIWPYTWQHKRAIVAGHSAHYARESREHHHAAKITSERSSPVKTGVTVAQHCQLGPLVTSHLSHSARYCLSGDAFAN